MNPQKTITDKILIIENWKSIDPQSEMLGVRYTFKDESGNLFSWDREDIVRTPVKAKSSAQFEQEL